MLGDDKRILEIHPTEVKDIYGGKVLSVLLILTKNVGHLTTS